MSDSFNDLNKQFKLHDVKNSVSKYIKLGALTILAFIFILSVWTIQTLALRN